MSTNEVHAGTTESPSDWNGPPARRRARRVLFRGAMFAMGVGSVGVVSAQEASGATGGDGGSGLYVTAAALALTAIAVGSVYLFSWRDRPSQTFTPGTPTEERVPNRHAGPMYESEVPSRETESVDHDAFDPVGTGAFIALYFAVIALMWLFMYFVEFLANGPKVVG